MRGKALLRYLVETTNHGNASGRSCEQNRQERGTLGLYGYSEHDLARNIDPRVSTSRHTILSRGDLVQWRSSKQKCVAASVTKSEYIALSEFIQKIRYYRRVLK